MEKNFGGQVVKKDENKSLEITDEDTSFSHLSYKFRGLAQEIKSWWRESAEIWWSSSGRTEAMCDEVGEDITEGKGFKVGSSLICEKCVNARLTRVDWEQAIGNLDKWFGPHVPQHLLELAEEICYGQKPSQENRWTEEEIARVPEDVRLTFERIEKDEYAQPGMFLVEQISKAKDAYVRAKAVLLLAQKRPHDLMNIALGLYDKDSRVRETTAQVIANSKNIRAFSGMPFFKESLMKAKNDEDERVQYWAKKCLEHL